ncbi:uncharacterized protein LOC113549785 [Rhopalosiphum maidis]|uniref:uncharacterized protein LOC113549785 n=1 Tax=Rhopalosiphum maidis TaxID=43146 RepID=UPI000F00E3F7|nr:uncharacterized protein LOC113549785 [Rhopalosiphum maidis]
MSFKSVLNNLNKGFLIFGIGCTNYGQRYFKTNGMFHFLRFLLVSVGIHQFYRFNKWLSIIDQEVNEVTSLVIITCYEFMFIGTFIAIVWRIFYDKKLSIILTKIEKIHEKLIRLNVARPMKTIMNWFFIIGITLHVIANITIILLWIKIDNTNLSVTDMLSWMCLVVSGCSSFYEYILLILYIRWMVYMANENISERKSCFITFRDMYLEVIECLNDVNNSIYGLPVILAYITGNICDIIITIYSDMLFPRDYSKNDGYYSAFAIIELLLKTANVIILYGVGHITEKEVNRISFVLHQRSVIERNPRIKRQIKIFILRRLHEFYRFELYGICQINLRKLLSLVNKTFAYLLIQIMFKLNKK